MALKRGSANRFNANIWPGFVDAMTALLLVLMFVLTIFVVVQFVLRDTITGQASRLNELTEEVATLAAALGIERDRGAELSASLEDSGREVAAQQALIATLTRERDTQAEALADAASRITGFEAQVAGLLAQRRDAMDGIAALEAERDGLLSAQEALQADQTRLMTEQEALNLALAQARDEIDAGEEAARLAAARREALEAMIADLRRTGEEDRARISTLETTLADERATLTAQLTEAEAALIAAQRAGEAALSEAEVARLAEAAAAEALRARLQDADAELTAMTLALEEQRREAEATLTLLAAAEAARDGLDLSLAAALLARQQLENELSGALTAGDDLDARLAAALGLQAVTAAELQQAQAALAAGAAAREDLATRLAAAISARSELEGDLLAAEEALQRAMEEGDLTRAEVEARLAAAVTAQAALEAELAAASQTGAEAMAERDGLEQRLAEALLARTSLEAEVASLRSGAGEGAEARATLEARLAEALAAEAAARDEAARQLSAAERQANLLALANRALTEEEALSADSLRQVALLNEQVGDLRRQVGTLQTLLDIAAEGDAEAQVQIEALGAQLNTALARVAAEERRRRMLEESERVRLEAEAERLSAEAQDLERYRSEFFGELREVLAGQEGVRIEGDRFVFSSEVLFETGQATLSAAGEAEISNVAAILRGIAGDIPPGIDWVIRVDGHTDNQPLSGLGTYANNWELSQARALSVVLYLIGTENIPPQRLAANGFGEYQPVDPADTPEARALNRRIELKLTER